MAIMICLLSLMGTSFIIKAELTMDTESMIIGVIMIGVALLACGFIELSKN